VLRVVAHVVLVEEFLQLVEQLFIQRRRTADRQRQSVADQRPAFRERAQLAAARAVDADPVLGGDFPEIHRLLGQADGLVEKGAPQAEAGALYIG
jgi:hypothetical protein